MTEAKAREIVAREVGKRLIPAYATDAIWAEDLARLIERAEKRPQAQDNPFLVADSILTALGEAGLAIVPVEATEEMLYAETDDGWGPVNVAGPYYERPPNGGTSIYLNSAYLQRIWTAMLTASQSPAPDQ